MNLDDSQEEDCTVYIEQLKSDNASLKLNAASKIGVIASVLGHNRIRNELIPYLIQIIEQMDNDNDFLIKVAEGILELKMFCSGVQQLSILINPLKILATLDQPSVRDAAIKSLKGVPQGLNNAKLKGQIFRQIVEFHQKYYYNLIKSLIGQDQAYPCKIIVCNLIPITYPYLTQDGQQQLRNMFQDIALKDNSPLVRRSLAENIPTFSQVLPKNLRKQPLLMDIWSAFIRDPIDIIRIKALQCTTVVARPFPAEVIGKHFLKLARTVEEGKNSWRIRYAMVQCLAEMLDILEKQFIKLDVVQSYELLLKDIEAEVKAIAFINCPKLTKKLSKKQSFTVFFQYYEKAVKEVVKQASPIVKLAVVQSIVPFLESIQPEQVSENGISMIASLIKDQNVLVRVNTAKCLKDLQRILGKQNTLKYLIPMIEGCLADKKWRFKLSIVQNITPILLKLQWQVHSEFMNKFFTSFLKDHNYTIRLQTIKCLSKLKDSLDGQVLNELINKFMEILLNDTNSIYRITGCNMFEQMIHILNKKQICDLFVVLLKKLQNEKVPNVFITLFVIYGKYKGQLDGKCKKEFQNFTRKVQETSIDEDVLYYAAKCDEL